MSGKLAELSSNPNLTPLLDMVFQLITFFMLVINFRSAELDQTLILPVVGSARTVKDVGPILVLNVRVDKDHPNGCLVVYNTPKSDIEGVINHEALVELIGLGWKPEDVHEGGKELPTTIVLRADQSTPFHVVNRVITCCQENGYRKFALKTAPPPEKKS
jgi:biopolymer transport protein ExbD